MHTNKTNGIPLGFCLLAEWSPRCYVLMRSTTADVVKGVAYKLDRFGLTEGFFLIATALEGNPRWGCWIENLAIIVRGKMGRSSLQKTTVVVAIQWGLSSCARRNIRTR